MVRGKCVPFKTFFLIIFRILSMSICFGKYFWINLVVSMRSFNLEVLVHKKCLVFHIFLKLYLPEMENFLLYLHSCLSHCPINLSGYLRDQLYQEVLVEVLHMDQILWRWPMLYFGTYLWYDACRIYLLSLG